MAFLQRIGNRIFQYVHSNNLIYNTCWEDPRIDREAMELTRDDHVLVITSAGCNALDYALAGAGHVYAVDMNPRQNAVLELKMAGIRCLDYGQFFNLFGLGRLDDVESIYQNSLRKALSPEARVFWDKHLHYFSTRKPGNSFYYHGTTGAIARYALQYLSWKPGLREGMARMFDAEDIEKQREVYYSTVRDATWTPFFRWLVCNDFTLYLAGVPKAQREQIELNYSGGVAELLEECIDGVFAYLSLQDNYFWRVYVMGCYTHQCCPEYLKEDNFHRLKNGVVDRVSVSTNTVEGFLREHPGTISRFVLLDHMDWLASHRLEWLRQEWQAIVDKASPDARVLFRSGGLRVEYVNPLEVRVGSEHCQVGELLRYNPALAQELHARDRVHMYGSFYIADLVTA